MLGGNGDDFVNSVAGGADVMTGDAGTDTVFVDSSDTVSTVESETVVVGKLGGSAKTITGDAGKTVSLPYSGRTRRPGSSSAASRRSCTTAPSRSAPSS